MQQYKNTQTIFHNKWEGRDRGSENKRKYLINLKTFFIYLPLKQPVASSVGSTGWKATEVTHTGVATEKSGLL